MATRFKQTTEETQELTGNDQPVNVTYTGPDDREVRMRVGAPAIIPVRERNGQLRPQPSEPQRGTSLTDLFVVGNWLQSIQSIQQQQLALLNEINSRLDRSSENAGMVAVGSSPIERATWWALWGVLMLILGAALVVILLLILGPDFRILRFP